ncbi:MAG: DUF2127 domain-containing protein [Patescibacteria group bacterium]
MEFTEREKKNIGRGFYFSILLKGIISLGEIVVGILALCIPITYVIDLLLRLPSNIITVHAVSIMEDLVSVGGIFIAVYLLSRGLVKILLIIGMLKNQLWAYPTSLTVLALFVLYQMYQIFMTHSLAIVALTIFDLIVMWFIWKEYEVVKGNGVQK